MDKGLIVRKHVRGSVIVILVIYILFQLSCNNNSESDSKGAAKIEFKEVDFDFGKIKQGEKVAHRFVFKNAGTGDLLIKNVEPGCGCTVANYPKQAVREGEESFIEASFDSEGFRGLCVKSIDVYTNSQPARYTLTISATVEEN